MAYMNTTGRNQRKAVIPPRQRGEITKSETTRSGVSAGTEENSPIYASEINDKNPIFTLNKESVLQGLIFSEVLGKPKSRRTGR